MDFEIPEELKMVQDAARQFVKKELLPLEKKGLSPEKISELERKVKEMGFWNLCLPEELGGAGLGVLAGVLVQEELGKTTLPFDFGDVKEKNPLKSMIIKGGRLIGGAQRLLETAALFAKNWQIFGTTIADLPKIKRALAEMSLDIQVSKLLTYWAASKADRGEDVKREVALVGIFTAEMFERVSRQAAEIHGGPGFTGSNHNTNGVLKSFIAKEILKAVG